MSLVTNAPRLTAATAEQLAADFFDIRGQASPLPSERDQNFRIDTPDGRAFVLKIANPAEDRAMLEAENATMRHLASIGLVPTVIDSRTGAGIARHEQYFVRLITVLPGRPLASVKRQTDALLADLGRAVGRLDRSLESFDHPALHREFYWDLATAPGHIARHLPRVADPQMLGAVESIVRLHHEAVAPRLPALRRSVIHGDVNDFNVLADPSANRITGIVDFGDMVFSHTANDAAVAMAYASLDKTDPLGAAAIVAAGYHQENPLTEDEIAALFGLMLTRLALSVTVAADQQAARPDSAYLGISQPAIARTLPALVAIHPRLAHYRIREACGLSPVPHAPLVVEWLRAHANRLAPLTGHDLKSTPVLGLDMSAGSPLVSSNPRENAAEPFSHRVFAAMDRAGAAIGVGGYDEARLIYATDAYATGPVTAERRTVHIGIDVTMPAGAPLFAPLGGVVHGFEDAATRLDYGPVIVLRHEIPGDEPASFYTLYGHLDRASLDGLHVGKVFKAGDRLGAIGQPPVNGDWWPHVHVQIVTDMLDVPCNFNGVAPASQRATWLSISPDTNLILGDSSGEVCGAALNRSAA